MNSLLSHRNVEYCRTAISSNSIDLYWSRIWLRHNSSDAPTSVKHSKKTGKKYKFLTNTLPTTDILHKHYPNLIEETLDCFLCGHHKESNSSLWLCPAAQDILHNISRRLRSSIINTILTNSAHNKATIESFIDNLNIFKWYPNSSTNSITTDHPLYMLIHQLIPKDLTCIFKKFLKKQKSFSPFLLNTLELFYNDINNNIWKFRCKCFKIWKDSYGISKQDFKNYSRPAITGRRRRRTS